MEKKVIAEGKTTNEAIENGLKQLKVSKNKVDIKVLDSDDKRSFFSILSPRIVKVELTVKEGIEEEKPRENSVKTIKRDVKLSLEEQKKAKENIENFIKELLVNLPENTQYKIETSEEFLKVNINNKDLGFLIGYRGETLYSMQNIMSVIAGKGIENKVRVILDIEGYKQKREKTLEELAEKVAKTVIKTKKSITLEPMQAYERKIIHSKLQENEKIDTTSVGEEPHRKVVISFKK